MFVDDETAILDQSKMFLEKLNENLKVYPVISAVRGLQEIKNRDYDIIVSDYQMPNMDGLEFLRKIRKDRKKDTPFIIFTGKGREEVAMEALKLGANNYIQKGGDPRAQYGMLADVIDQEVRLYKAEKAKANLVAIVESSQNAIISKDLEGYITSWNKGAEKIYGYKPEEAIGKHISMIIPDESEEEIERILKTIQKGKTIESYDTIRITKDGKEIHVSLTVSPIKNKEGKVTSASAVAQDITERKNAEEKIYRLNQVLNSIRNVNQVIIRENDRGKLVNKICDILIENRSYSYSGISLFDEENELSLFSQSGRDEQVEELEFSMEKGALPKCISYTLENSGINIFEEQYCDNCPYFQGCDGGNNLAIRLEYENKVYGTLNVSLPKKYSDEIEELGLLEEVAGDISFALYNIEMKEKLDKEERKSKRIIDSMLDGFIILNKEDIHTYVNEAFCKMTGFSEDEIIGKGPPFPYWPKKRIDEIEEAFKRTKKGEFKDLQLYFQRKDGNEFPVIVSPEALKDGSGDYINIFANVKDISKIKEQEIKLQNINERLEVLLGNIPGMAYRCSNDKNWTMELVSEGSLALTGYKPGQLLENNVISYGDLIHPDDREYVWLNIQRSIEDKKSFKLIYKITDKDGTEKWVWEQGRPLFDSDGELEALEGLILDITERKKLEDKEKFLHTLLRHDLKNKVHVIHGYLQILEEKYEDDEIIKRAIKTAKNEAALIEKVRTLNEIDQESVYPIKLDVIIDKVISEYEQTFKNNRIDIKYSKTESEILGGVLLEDLFDNMIENAIIHSDCNLIQISVTEYDDETVVTIEDDGKGISKKYRKNLFDKGFSFGKNAGTGLGFFLSKEITENYGGCIELKDSSLGGARFDLHFKRV